MSSSNTAPSTPFEWLSGGLFFGNKGDSASQIDSCKDAGVLLNGVKEDADQLFSMDVGNSEQQEDVETSNKGEEQREERFNLLASRLRRLRFLLYEERRQTSQMDTPKRPLVASRVVEILVKTEESTSSSFQDLVPLLLKNLSLLPFEARKDAAAIFNYLLVCGFDGRDAHVYKPIMMDFTEYIDARIDTILQYIVTGHDPQPKQPDVILHYGSLYRSCLRHVSTYRLVVSSKERVEKYIFPFLDIYPHSPNFDLASDAMDSLKVILGATKNSNSSSNNNNNKNDNNDMNDATTKSLLTAQFLDRDYTAIWDDRFNPKLLVSTKKSDYIIRRMALQILSTVLLMRSNYNIMVRYIASKQNLRMVMILLRDKSPHITLDAFHVFKIFVANPNKPPDVKKILCDNKVKLCAYLKTLHAEREAKDVQFRDEKALVISTIESLQL